MESICISFTCDFLFSEEKCRDFHTLTPGSEKGKNPHALFFIPAAAVCNPNYF